MGLWGRIRRCSQCRGSETVLCDYGSMSMHGWQLLMEPVLPLVSSLDPLCLMPVDRASELFQRAILFYLSPPGFRCFQSKCMQMRTKWKKLMTNLNSHCPNYVPHEPHTLHSPHIRAIAHMRRIKINFIWNFSLLAKHETKMMDLVPSLPVCVEWSADGNYDYELGQMVLCLKCSTRPSCGIGTSKLFFVFMILQFIFEFRRTKSKPNLEKVKRLHCCNILTSAR